MNPLRALSIVAVPCIALLVCCAGLVSANIILNPGFELGTGADADGWIQEGGPSGSTTRSDAMPASGGFGMYMQADHINNPAAPTPYAIFQFSEPGSIDNTLNYNLSFSAKVDSLDFEGFDMFYQIQWLDRDDSDGGGVIGETLVPLIPAGIDASYQSFGMSDIDVPDGSDSYQLRFQLSPGAVENIANGLYVDDVVLEVAGGGGFLPGDSNGDGVVNTLDIDPFVQALTDPTGYMAAFPAVPFLGHNDINSDGLVNTLDIDPFVGLLTEPGAQNVPEPAGALVLLVGVAVAARPRRVSSGQRF